MTKKIDFAAALGIPPLPSTSSETISALLWAREALQKHITTTYAVKDPKGIEELKPVKIGGVDQWLHIRGRNRNNPVLLWLHGGPGSPMIGFADAIQRPWEEYFTVVNWDQRQTGKSYYTADDENAPLSVEQFVTDTEEVIQYLRDYLKQDKLFVMGSSWGTTLGMHVVKRHPEWLHAYVGVGQVVSSLEGERTLYKRLIERAKANGEHQLAEKVEAMIPCLDYSSPEREKANVEHCPFVRKELARLSGETIMHHLGWEDTVKMFNFERLISPHLTLTDISNSVVGDDPAVFRVQSSFAREFFDIDLPKALGSSFEVPIFFFTGAHDWQTPVVLSDKWFQEISAPYKALLHFQESGHFVVNEEPGKFLMALVSKVLPFAKTEEEGD